ncbi:MAG: FtsX-like permease family protein, partial [Raoultibacter sp.]
ELVRLVDGRLLNPDDHYAAVVHVDLAEANGLTIGDRIALTTAENLHAEAEIVGLFAGAGGNEGEQGTTTARTQSFNQLYIDNTTISDLGATGYRELRLMLTDPNSIDETLAAVTQACGAGYATEVYDSALAALTPTLDRTASAAQATLALVALTGVVAVSMLLAMWGKQRTHERAILLSLGRSRAEVILQALIESMVLFALAALISSVVASILMPLLSNNLIPSAALAAAQAVGMSITGGLSPADVAWISGVGFLMASTLTATCTAITLRRNPRDLLVEKR